MIMMLKMSNDQISQFIHNNNLGNNMAYKKSRQGNEGLELMVKIEKLVSNDLPLDINSYK